MLVVISVLWFICCAATGVWALMTPYIIFDENSIKIHSGLVSPRKIAFSDIEKIEVEKQKRAFIYLKTGSKIKTNFSVLNKHDRIKFIEFMQRHYRTQMI